MAKSSKLPLLLGLAGLAGLAVAMQPKGDLVTASSGTSYRVELVSNTGGVKTYDVRSASGSLILRYSQTGSDTSSRKLVAVGEGTSTAVIRATGADFGVPLPS